MDETVIRVNGEIVELWPLVAPLLQRALDAAAGELTLDDVGLSIATQRRQLWLTTDSKRISGAAVTELVKYEQLTAVRVVLLGGQDMDDWSPMMEAAIKDFGRREGARRLEAVGRKGLERKLRPLGWEPKFVVYTKEIV